MSLKRKILFKAADFGLDQPLVELYESLTGRLDWGPQIRVGDDIQNGTHVQRHRGDVLLPLFIITEKMCLRTFTLGYAFRANGYRPTIVYDTSTLPEDGPTPGQHTYDMGVAKDKYLLRWFAERFPANCVSTGEILPDSWDVPGSLDVSRDPDASYEHSGVDISDAAMATTRKDLRRYSIDLTRESHYQAYRKNIVRGMMIADTVQRLIDRHDIEAVMSWDVFYTRGRIPLEVCEANGIKGYTHESGYTRGHIGYGSMRNSVPHWRYIDTDIVSSVLDTELSEEEQRRVETVMNKRASDDPDYNEHTIDADVSIDSSADTTVGVFSHLLWDGALEPDQAIYSDIYNWLEDTIDTGRHMPDVKFILKAHPAESLRETNETLADWIAESYGTLPENFSFLPSDTDVDAYKLIDKLDAGVVYGSTVGLEMAFDGLPVLTGGYPPYRGFNITIDPDSKRAYRSQLEKIAQLDAGAVPTERARRFAYLLFVLKQPSFPYLYEYISERPVHVRHDEVTERLNPVVTQVLNGEEVLSEEPI